MTGLLYLEDFDVETCNATVVSVSQTDDGFTDIELDKTCFYPRGGGQDWDTGHMSTAEARFSVKEVRLDENGTGHHIGSFDGGSFNAGDAVSCKVDHDRRAINTRLHSAGHVIDMAIDALGLDWVAAKGQHYPHLSAVEYVGTWDPLQADSLRETVEQKANELVARATDNSLKFVSVADMHKFVRHVPSNIPTNKPARVVMYGEDFGIPCGGTHVKNLSQIGTVHVPKVKVKKGVIRVNYNVEGIH